MNPLIQEWVERDLNREQQIVLLHGSWGGIPGIGPLAPIARALLYAIFAADVAKAIDWEPAQPIDSAWLLGGMDALAARLPDVPLPIVAKLRAIAGVLATHAPIDAADGWQRGEMRDCWLLLAQAIDRQADAADATAQPGEPTVREYFERFAAIRPGSLDALAGQTYIRRADPPAADPLFPEPIESSFASDHGPAPEDGGECDA